MRLRGRSTAKYSQHGKQPDLIRFLVYGLLSVFLRAKSTVMAASRAVSREPMVLLSDFLLPSV